jgi:hypothetical protein
MHLSNWEGMSVATCLVATLVACAPTEQSMEPLICELLTLYQEENSILQMIASPADAEKALHQIEHINGKLCLLDQQFEKKEQAGIYFEEQLELLGLHDQWYSLVEKRDTLIQKLHTKHLMTGDLERCLARLPKK